MKNLIQICANHHKSFGYQLFMQQSPTEDKTKIGDNSIRLKGTALSGITREGKAGLVAKHGSIVYKPGITSAGYKGVIEHYEPVFNTL